MTDVTPPDALSADRIRERLSEGARGILREMTVVQETDSTNSMLTRLPPESSVLNLFRGMTAALAT